VRRSVVVSLGRDDEDQEEEDDADVDPVSDDEDDHVATPLRAPTLVVPLAPVA
jgi:hypothetical protein